jgi:hypothetical protein
MRAAAQQRVQQQRDGGDNCQCGLHDTLEAKERRNPLL